MLKTIKNGILNQNPTFVLLLGMCPTLATTTSLENGFGMGLSAAAVLICSNIVISLIKSVIPQNIRIAAYVVVIAGFVTIVEMVLKAYLPDLYNQLGIFIPLIVVNCIILARAEAFASKNSVLESALDGLGMGLGFTLALSIISIVREVLGSGTILGYQLFGEGFNPASIIILTPGGFLTLGLILGVINTIKAKRRAH